MDSGGGLAGSKARCWPCRKPPPASNHSTRNLPVLLAGGGFRHGQHLAFDPASPPPLSNLYLSMLQRLGIEADKFGSSTGTLTGLEAKA